MSYALSSQHVCVVVLKLYLGRGKGSVFFGRWKRIPHLALMKKSDRAGCFTNIISLRWFVYSLCMWLYNLIEFILWMRCCSVWCNIQQSVPHSARAELHESNFDLLAVISSPESCSALSLIIYRCFLQSESFSPEYLLLLTWLFGSEWSVSIIKMEITF